jgi:hypothetical protein
MSTQNPSVAPPRQNQTSDYERPRTGVRRTFTETKAGVKTTEFYVMLVFVAGVLLATYADQDTLARRDGWFFAALAVGAYIISRGLSKLGSREPYTEDRDR